MTQHRQAVRKSNLYSQRERLLAKGGRDKIAPFLYKHFPQPEVCCAISGLQNSSLQSGGTASFYPSPWKKKFLSASHTSEVSDKHTDIPYLNNGKCWLKPRVFSLKRGQRLLCILSDFAATQS